MIIYPGVETTINLPLQPLVLFLGMESYSSERRSVKIGPERPCPLLVDLKVRSGSFENRLFHTDKSHTGGNVLNTEEETLSGGNDNFR